MPDSNRRNGNSAGRALEVAALVGASLFYGYHINTKWQERKELADLILTVDNECKAQRLPRSLRNNATEILAESFLHSPAYTSIFRESEEERRKALNWLFAKNIDALQSKADESNGDIQLWCKLNKFETSIDMVAFTMLVHCEHDFTTWEYIQNGFLLAPFRFGMSKIRIMFQVDEWIKEREKQVRNGRECMILNRMAVHRDYQGKGIGSSFLQYVLENNPRKDLPCQLSTQEPRNVVFYSRLGFKVVLEDTFEADDPNYTFKSYFMW
eukprot:CAMPEP_0204869498 /NCGR_PEP_ID=MMETSP1348-20121228/29917_1 /ASSEMBLY_ACC=CAM_ASM_000700 /TAXON_ID=215587 /ORGANISM="Aplanochytrium stocchinoi, Strain GSBS06" /LENGTH=267 /DNA_ID=CAMNT_0052022891 /DNA_START=58 /DNA_END=858 /DNA_ORIENTATION=-